MNCHLQKIEVDLTNNVVSVIWLHVPVNALPKDIIIERSVFTEQQAEIWASTMPSLITAEATQALVNAQTLNNETLESRCKAELDFSRLEAENVALRARVATLESQLYSETN